MKMINAIRRLIRKYPAYLYSEKELEEYEKYVEKCLGEYDSVFHEMVSPDIHLDVILIPETEECPYKKLVTMGAGAYKMKVPKEFKKYNLERAEYVIYLPADWDIQSSDEKDYWPIRLLKGMARLPIYCDSWLAYGHTIQANEDGSPYADNTKFNNSILCDALGQDGEFMHLKMSSGKEICFYQIVPIYQEELDYKFNNSADDLFTRMAENKLFPMIDVNRENVAEMI